jgi:hypothetical protein
MEKSLLLAYTGINKVMAASLEAMRRVCILWEKISMLTRIGLLVLDFGALLRKLLQATSGPTRDLNPGVNLPHGQKTS